MSEPINMHRGMTEDEAAFERELYEALNEFCRTSERSQQSASWVAGISDIGFCQEYVRRMLSKQEPSDTDMLKAFIGTALGDHMEQAWKARWGDEVLIQPEVKVTLTGEQYKYTIPGHPDAVWKFGRVLDGKTTFGLTLARREGMTEQQKKFQRHLYGLAAWNYGLFNPDVELEDVEVGNIWLDRSGNETCLHVKWEPLSLEVVEEATRWVDEAVYRARLGQEAEKTPSREVCEQMCGFFRECRLFDTDVSGLLEDPTHRRAAALYHEARASAQQAERDTKEAKAALDGVSGSTGEFMVRWTWINPSEDGKRAGYSRLDVKPIRRK